MRKTYQEYFDIVATHLLTQKKKSLVEGDSNCAYRGANGLKCAIGALIPDNSYSESMEKKDIRTLVLYGVERLNNFLSVGHKECGLKILNLFKIQKVGKNVAFLAQLQQVHDSYYPEAWKRELATIAMSYKLKTDVLEKF